MKVNSVHPVCSPVYSIWRILVAGKIVFRCGLKEFYVVNPAK